MTEGAWCKWSTVSLFLLCLSQAGLFIHCFGGVLPLSLFERVYFSELF